MSAGVELESLSPSEKEFKNCHIQEVHIYVVQNISRCDIRKYIPPPIHLVLEALEFITHNLAPEGWNYGS